MAVEKIERPRSSSAIVHHCHYLETVAVGLIIPPWYPWMVWRPESGECRNRGIALDGSGYHRQVSADHLSAGARLLRNSSIWGNPRGVVAASIVPRGEGTLFHPQRVMASLDAAGLMARVGRRALKSNR